MGCQSYMKPPLDMRIDHLGTVQVANAFSGLASSPRAPGSCLRSLPVPEAGGDGGRQGEVPQGTCRETSLLTYLSGQAVTDCQGRE